MKEMMESEGVLDRLDNLAHALGLLGAKGAKVYLPKRAVDSIRDETSGMGFRFVDTVRPVSEPGSGLVGRWRGIDIFLAKGD